MDPLDEVVELRVARLHAAKVDDAFAHVLGELIAQRPARHTHDRKLFWKQAGLLEVKERRQQFALGQIARGPKDHHDPRSGNLLSAFRDLRKILWTYLHLHCFHNLPNLLAFTCEPTCFYSHRCEVTANSRG